jgi:hypothetical protein
MNLHEFKVVFLVVTAVSALLVASPALQRVLVYPQTEFFTELSLLGPSHAAGDYPYNIARNGNYTVFLGVANHLGSCAWYIIEVKFRNQTQSAPDSFAGTPSSLQSLYNITAFIADKESLEVPVSFVFNYSFQNVTRIVYTNVTVSQGPGKNDTIKQRADNIALLQVNFKSLMLNGVTLNLQSCSSDWNPHTSEFFGNLVFELWIYDGSAGGFQYHERSVDLKFNVTNPVLS